jgi:aldehyde:ferredoxin oxidoreductase
VNKIVPYLGWALRVLNYFPELAFFKIPLLPHLYEIEYVTGMKMNIGKFKRIGERSYNIERAVNAKFGVSADMDKLPKRLVEDLQDPDRPNSRVPLEKLKKIYYRARGWNKNGLPSKLKLRLLGIK